MDGVGGFESALHDQLDLIRKANASVVSGGAKVASMKPLMGELLKVTEKFSDETEADWGIWKIDLKNRARLYDKNMNTGILLHDPQNLMLEIIDEHRGKQIKLAIQEAAQGTVSAQQLALT